MTASTTHVALAVYEAQLTLDLATDALPDQVYRYSRAGTTFIAEVMKTTWLWDARNLHWELSRIKVSGPRRLKDGSLGQVVYENEYRDSEITYTIRVNEGGDPGPYPRDTVPTEVLHVAESKRPALVA